MSAGDRTGPEVWKFGGSSLADADRIRHVARLVTDAADIPVVVVSATGDTTDDLVLLRANAADGSPLDVVADRHRALLDELAPDDAEARTALEARIAAVRATASGTDPDERGDTVIALGEDLSALVVAATLRAAGTPARAVDARTVMRTDATWGAARPAEAAIRDGAARHLLPVVAEGTVPVVQGFVGSTADGRTTTLGRGGSDFTATLLGAAMRSSAVHIWTDVDGILTGDPRTVGAPRVLDVVGFEEAVELAWFGATVLHPGAAKQAVARGVPVRIRSTFHPERPGTLILEERWGGPGIAAIAHKPHVVLIKVRSRPSALPYGFLARVFEIMTRHEIVVDLVATSHTSTSFTVDEGERIEAVARELDEVADVQVTSGLATVTVVGNGLLREPGFDARVFRTVGFTPVHLISQASDVSLSFVVDAAEAPRVVARLHADLVEGRIEPPRSEKTG